MMPGSDASLTTRVHAASDEAALREAARMLRDGQIVAFPTDTVYGLGCDLWQAEAVERLYWAKRRPKNLAIPVLVSEPHQTHQVVPDLPSLFDLLVERFWPGGLTLILRRVRSVPDVLCAGGDTIAVRMPDHPLALRLIADMGGALAATSANLSGHPAPTTAADALAGLKGRVPLILDGGKCPGGVASSIVNLVAEPPVLLREGALDAATLCEVLPDLVRAC